MNEQVFVTNNLKLAMALTAAGFSIRNAHNVIIQNASDSKFKDRKVVICELDPEHNGVTANYLKEGFEFDVTIGKYRTDLVARVNAIIEARGITQEEYVILAFDAARAGLHNRGTVVFCVNQNRPLIAKEMKDGRSLIYLDGTPRAQLKQILEDS